MGVIRITMQSSLRMVATFCQTAVKGGCGDGQGANSNPASSPILTPHPGPLPFRGEGARRLVLSRWTLFAAFVAARGWRAYACPSAEARSPSPLNGERAGV